MPLSPGARLGPYEVVAPIGAGGMGEVWKARDTRLDRTVAIKVLPAEFAQDIRLKLRFEREAKTISQLNHPHICTLHDIGQENGMTYLVMELLEGQSLADRLENGPLPLADVLRYGSEVAEALDKAHRMGIVHRDLKPGNIMITKSGAKLLDFGLAKSTAIAVTPHGATQQKPLTQEGTILGTFQYMAPEQLEGEEADARTDIFALGTVLYEMATGHRAFQGKSRTSLIAAIVGSEPIPVSQLQPLAPAALDHIIRGCLAKDREDRWQSAHDIAEDLRWMREGGSQAGVIAPLIGRNKARERATWIAVIAVAIAGTFGVARWMQVGVVSPPAYRFSIPMIGAGYRFGRGAALTPDGKTLYFSAENAAGQQQLFRRPLSEPNATPVEGTQGISGFILSPDSKSIVLFAAGRVRRMSIEGGPTETIGETTLGWGGAVSPDGTLLVARQDSPIQQLGPDGKFVPITVLGKNEIAHFYPDFLPDGKTFLFTTQEPDPDRGVIRHTLCAMTLGSKSVTRLGPIPSRAVYAGGNVFYVRDGTLVARPFDVSNLKFTGEAVAVAEGVLWFDHTAAAAFSVSLDGSTIAYESLAAAKRLVWIDANGKQVGTLADPAAYALHDSDGRLAPLLTMTPDGSRVVVPVQDARSGVVSLWVLGTDRETRSRLTSNNVWEAFPVSTHDGKRIIFSSDRLGKPPDIFEQAIDGGERPRLLLSWPGVQYVRDVSPDDRFVLFATWDRTSATGMDLWVLPLGGGSPRPFVATPGSDVDGVFSPDGRWVAYQSDSSGSYQIYLKPFPGPGAALQVSTRGGRSPRFSRDGRKLYFSDGRKLFAADMHAGGATGEPALLFETDERIQTYQPAKNGDRFLMMLESDADASPSVNVITGWQPPKK